MYHSLFSLFPHNRSTHQPEDAPHSFVPPPAVKPPTPISNTVKPCKHLLPCGLCNLTNTDCKLCGMNKLEAELSFSGEDVKLKCNDEIYGNLFDGD